MSFFLYILSALFTMANLLFPQAVFYYFRKRFFICSFLDLSFLRSPSFRLSYSQREMVWCWESVFLAVSVCLALSLLIYFPLKSNPPAFSMDLILLSKFVLIAQPLISGSLGRSCPPIVRSFYPRITVRLSFSSLCI